MALFAICIPRAPATTDNRNSGRSHCAVSLPCRLAAEFLFDEANCESYDASFDSEAEQQLLMGPFPISSLCSLSYYSGSYPDGSVKRPSFGLTDITTLFAKNSHTSSPRAGRAWSPKSVQDCPGDKTVRSNKIYDEPFSFEPQV